MVLFVLFLFVDHINDKKFLLVK